MFAIQTFKYRGEVFTYICLHVSERREQLEFKETQLLLSRCQAGDGYVCVREKEEGSVSETHRGGSPFIILHLLP